MKFVNKLERKYGKYAIHNLMYYIIILYGLGFVINTVNPGIYNNFLSLDAEAILHGQIWRIITFMMLPPSNSIIFVVFALYLYYMIGTNLERAWGAFRFNLYFFTGVLGHVLVAILVYLVTYFATGVGQVYLLDTTFLNFSLFFAFAAVYPDVQFMIYFIIPVKVKYLAYLNGGFFLLSIITAVINKDWATVLAVTISLLNFSIYFLTTRNYKKISPNEIYRRKAYQQQVKQPKNITKHKCAVCGMTESEDENLEFRFCSKCDGNYEYCQEHLFTHEHRKRN